MTTITNSDTGATREAEIITAPPTNGGLPWYIAAWPAPDSGWSKVDGNGHGWQIVCRQKDGTYTYNGEMMGGFRDSLEDVRALAVKSRYTLA